jgi:hypothetical protein
LKEERNKRVKGDEINTNLLLKLKNYPIKENGTIFEIQKGCKATIDDLQSQIKEQNDKIHKLNQDLSEKAIIIANFDLSRSE